MKENGFYFLLHILSTISLVDISSYFVNNFPNPMGTLSIFLSRFVFASLLVAMFSYWFQATLKYNGDSLLGKIPSYAMWSSNISLMLILSIRWIESGHFPLSNLYESLLFLSWSLTSIHLVLEGALNKNSRRLLQHTHTPQLAGSVNDTKNQVEPILTLGAITSPLSLFTNAFATFSLPPEMQKVTVLVPALQSNWLIMHVSVMIISYAALLSGSLLAIAFLVIKLIENNKFFLHVVNLSTKLINRGQEVHRNSTTFTYPNSVSPSGTEGMGQSPQDLTLDTLTPKGYQHSSTDDAYPNSVSPSATAGMGQQACTPFLSNDNHYFSESAPYFTEITQIQNEVNNNSNVLLTTLDNLSYRSISLGFAFLTIGILSGAVWANETWGSYWSWDPKETWAFVTWLVFALYLHTRLSKGWIGKESSFVATFGFAIIWFCYLGVNLFGKGLHSYGWFHL